jgi:cobyrinic acid a,c-diamide synthase
VKTAVPRIVVGSSAPGMGKSLITLGLASVLRTHGLSVSCCVNGIALPQANLLSRLTRRFCRNLNSTLLSRDDIYRGFFEAAVGADLLIIDGHDDLYYGDSPGSLRGSDAELANVTQTPILFVGDGATHGTSIAPLYKGFMQALKTSLPHKLLVNFADPESSEDKVDNAQRDRVYFDAAMQLFGLSPVVGSIPVQEAFPVPKRLASEVHREPPLPRQFFLNVTSLARDFIDVEKVLELAQQAKPIELPVTLTDPSPRKVRVAVADDPCFFLTHKDNLDLLRRYGAELVFFSPLADQGLPRKVQGVYLPGGYLSHYAPDIVANATLMKILKDFFVSGGVIYSEGAGTAFISYSFTVNGTVYPGVGLIPARAKIRDSALNNLGPIVNQPLVGRILEPNILGDFGSLCFGLGLDAWEFSEEPQLVPSMEFRDKVGRPVGHGWSMSGRHFSSFALLHWGSNNDIALNFIEVCLEV